MALFHLSNLTRGLCRLLPLSAALAMSAALPARADLEIAGKATSNVTCSAGVCQATAAKAVLNVKELQSYLASGDVTVSSVSAGTAIDVKAGVHWKSHMLALDSHDSITVVSPMTVQGRGGVSVTTNDGGAGGRLLFEGAALTFKHTSSALTINGQPYQLEASLADMIAAVTNAPAGNYALVNDEDASQDPVYTTSPIGEVDGNVTFLGHTISNLSISTYEIPQVGLVGHVAGTLSSVVLKNVNIISSRIRRSGRVAIVGTVAGLNTGLVSNVAVSGTLSSSQPVSPVGGVVGQNSNTIDVAFSDVTVTGGDGGNVGGVTGVNFGTINLAAAIGSVEAGASATAGGVVGYNLGVIDEALAWGNVAAGDGTYVGGLVGDNYTTGGGSTSGTILDTYTIGGVSGTSGAIVGAFAGYNNAPAPGARGRMAAGTTSFCYAIPASGVALVADGDVGGIQAISQRKLTKRGPRLFQNRQYWTSAAGGDPVQAYLDEDFQ